MKRQITLKMIPVFTLALFAAGLTGCDSGSGALSSDGTSSIGIPGGPTGTTGGSNGAPAGEAKHVYEKQVLLFAGSGTWAAEVSDLENMFINRGVSYDKVSSAQMNALSAEDLAKYGAIVVPGGNAGTEGQGLTLAEHANIRTAVQQYGVGYVGFCAGAFTAIAPAATIATNTLYLGVVDGQILDYYYLENQGVDLTMTLYSFPDGSTEDIIYYGGPVTPEIKGGVVARYPNGEPSITQIWSGKGLVFVSGGHPAVSSNTLAGLGLTSSDGTHQDLAWSMIEAAMNQSPLPAF